ncbi:MAG: branched chain amino acid aminotransferase, partial [Bacteroidetes bacterium]
MNTLERELIIHPIAESRISEVDMNNLPFGRVFSDHMLLARYENGKWGIPEILPYGPIHFAPSMLSLHYGQAIFEGMKASRSASGEAVLFRAIDNLRRLNQSALRMSMPELPEALFMEGLRELVRIDKAWIPAADKGSLYIRPVMFASDESIGVRASESYIFSIMTCPVG